MIEEYNFFDVAETITHPLSTFRKGKLFRSGLIPYSLEEDSRSYFHSKIDLAIDLRSIHERTQNISLWNSTSINISLSDGTALTSYEDWIADLEERHPIDAVSGSYLYLFERNIAEFRHLIEIVSASPSEKILIHCSHGKDRTAIAIALILRLLGIPLHDIALNYEAAVRNYLKINKQLLQLSSQKKYNERTIYFYAPPKECIERFLFLVELAYGSIAVAVWSNVELSRPVMKNLSNKLLSRPLAKTF